MKNIILFYGIAFLAFVVLMEIDAASHGGGTVTPSPFKTPFYKGPDGNWYDATGKLVSGIQAL